MIAGGAATTSSLPNMTMFSNICTVIITCCGQIEHTRLCIPSVLRKSNGGFKLVAVYVESFDGTADYLDGVRDAAPVDVEVLKVPAGTSRLRMLRRGIASSSGPYIVHLANDTIVPRGWLDQLVALAETSPDLGLVGPMSNHAPSPQCVGIVPYKINPGAGPGPSPADVVNDFAVSWREQRRGQWSEVDGLSDFCLLIKGAVFDRLGLASRAGEAGLLDAGASAASISDLPRMASRVGFKSGCCHDLFVHHFGTRPCA